jgi:hypothetical protein
MHKERDERSGASREGTRLNFAGTFFARDVFPTTNSTLFNSETLSSMLTSCSFQATQKSAGLQSSGRGLCDTSVTSPAFACGDLTEPAAPINPE